MWHFHSHLYSLPFPRQTKCHWRFWLNSCHVATSPKRCNCYQRHTWILQWEKESSLTDEQHHLGARDQHWESQQGQETWGGSRWASSIPVYSHFKRHPARRRKKSKMRLSWFRVTNHLCFGGFPAEWKSPWAKGSSTEMEGCTTPFSGHKNRNNITELAGKASRDVAKVSTRHTNWSWAHPVPAQSLCHQLCPSRGTPKSPNEAQSGPKDIHRLKYGINISIIYININIRQ